MQEFSPATLVHLLVDQFEISKSIDNFW